MFKQLVTGLALIALGSNASAALIDFTSSTWSGVSGPSHTESVAGVGNVTLRALGGGLTFNDADSGGCSAGGGPGLGLACVGDGIGIGDDEITTRRELLSLSFSSPVDVVDIILLDLFSSEPEYATIRMTGSGFTTVGGSNDLGGLVSTGISGGGVTSILFFATGRYSDYSLAAVEVSAVPLPGALVLFLSGLAGFSFFRKRKAASV